MPTNADRAIFEACQDPAATGWFKDAAMAALERDPVDAAQDAEELARLLSERAGRITAEATVASAAPPAQPGAGG